MSGAHADAGAPTFPTVEPGGGADVLAMTADAQAAVVAIGRALRAAREAAGLSQTEVAHRAGTTQPHLNAIERARGRLGPSIDLLARLGRALGTPFAVLPAREVAMLRGQLEAASTRIAALEETLRQQGIAPPPGPDERP